MQTSCKRDAKLDSIQEICLASQARAVVLLSISRKGRNRFRGPSYFNADFSIMKNSKVPGWENGVLGIGFQFFNFFNHPNFSLPDNGSSDQTFGQIQFLDQPPTSILGSGQGGDVAPRMIQLKVQLLF